MPYCTVCKIETDYEYDVALSNGDYLHYSCIITLQMQKHEIETILQKQKSQLILSFFVPSEGVEQDMGIEAEIEDLRAKLAKLKSVIQSAIDNAQRIRFEYKKPRAKRWMTRVVTPERLLSIPNNREPGETLCVEGFCELRQDTRVFALERMQGLEIIED